MHTVYESVKLIASFFALRNILTIYGNYRYQRVILVTGLCNKVSKIIYDSLSVLHIEFNKHLLLIIFIISLYLVLIIFIY